jgi:hypothetical protein
MGPIAHAERHDAPGLIGELVPGVATVVDDVVVKIRFEGQFSRMNCIRTAPRGSASRPPGRASPAGDRCRRSGRAVPGKIVLTAVPPLLGPHPRRCPMNQQNCVGRIAGDLPGSSTRREGGELAGFSAAPALLRSSVDVRRRTASPSEMDAIDCRTFIT